MKNVKVSASDLSGGQVLANNKMIKCRFCGIPIHVPEDSAVDNCIEWGRSVLSNFGPAAPLSLYLQIVLNNRMCSLQNFLMYEEIKLTEEELKLEPSASKLTPTT